MKWNNQNARQSIIEIFSSINQTKPALRSEHKTADAFFKEDLRDAVS